MRRAVLVLALLALVAAGSSSEASKPPFRATLTAPTHTPKVKVKWYYTIRVADLSGKPITARLTEQVRDPTGQAHPVKYGPTQKNITNWRFTGRFRDYIIWPADSKLADFLGGLVLRATVKAEGASVVLTYRVKPR
jgi:hypothetical protein